jgi:hypothetical protein
MMTACVRGRKTRGFDTDPETEEVEKEVESLPEREVESNSLPESEVESNSLPESEVESNSLPVRARLRAFKLTPSLRVTKWIRRLKWSKVTPILSNPPCRCC